MDKIFDINSALCYIHHSFPIPSAKESKRKMHAMAHGNVRIKSIMVNMVNLKLFREYVNCQLMIPVF